jgi:hypothetical protein
MTRITLKYELAKRILPKINLDRDDLYLELNKLGYFWDTKIKQWVKTDSEKINTLENVRIRVWSKSEDIGKHTNNIIEALKIKGFTLLSESQEYVCRPPDHNQSRKYLEFSHSEDIAKDDK